MRSFEMNADDDRKAMPGTEGDAADGASLDRRLSELRSRLDAEQERQQAKVPTRRSDAAGMGQALKLGSEFVAGVIVGVVIGYSIDQLLGSSPWGLIVFLLLGFAAGTLNVLRATGAVAERLPPSGPGRDGA